MSKNKNSKTEETKEDLNFYQKMKTDKRYNAKVQIIAYGIFILLIIIFLNINSTNNNSNSTSIDTIIEDISTEEKTDTTEELSLLEKINNNYEYNINVSTTKNEETINQRYYGKSFDKNIEINKEVNGVTNKYYEVDGYYYIKNENDEFGLIQSNIIYDLIDEKYIELDDILKLIEKASLDHVVDSSTEDKESIYNLLIRDIVISNKSDDVVIIKVIEGTDKLSININYTNLMKALDETIKTCEISYEYTNIDNVEEFKIIEENINIEQ